MVFVERKSACSLFAVWKKRQSRTDAFTFAAWVEQFQRNLESGDGILRGFREMLQKFMFPDAQDLEKMNFPGELNKVKKYLQVPEEKEVNYLNLKQVLATRR